MSTQGNDKGWDEVVDLLMVGSGAGAMTAALCAHDRGARVLLIEKSDRYGGNTAMSGGAMWVPCNHLLARAGVEDTPEEAMRYLETLTGGVVPRDKLNAFVDTVPQVLRYLTEQTRLRVQAMLSYSDYYPEAPGGKPGGRSVEPEHFDARLLGEEFKRMREPAVQELIMKRVSMTATEAHQLLARHPGWGALTARIMARYWLDIGGRLRSKRDRCLSLGNALVGMLRRSLMDRVIPLWLETGARRLLVEDGRVVGVLAEGRGSELRLRAKKAVILAAGGFEGSETMRTEHLPAPTQATWTCGSPANTGDAIRMGQELGARLELMDDAWWGPVTVVPGEQQARMLVIEKGLPGCILVNKRGERFVNEAAPYNDIVKAMYEKNSPEAPTVPAHMIFDAQYRRKYPCGPFLQASQQPDWLLPKAFRQGYLSRADSLAGLAAALGIDAAGLAETVAKVNEYARAGRDLDFHRGESLFDRYYGDEKVAPNPCLAPLEKAPYYGITAYPGDLGTKGGLKTDRRARVLRENGEAIAGLYAVGNCAASVMGPTYPGAGATIAPAVTFAYIAAHDALGAA